MQRNTELHDLKMTLVENAAVFRDVGGGGNGAYLFSKATKKCTMHEKRKNIYKKDKKRQKSVT